MKQDLQAFTIRIPPELAAMIDARARTNRRTRNAEITFLLEEAIDASVERDRDLLKQMSGPSKDAP